MFVVRVVVCFSSVIFVMSEVFLIFIVVYF